jgi:uncharacterized membrane protein YeaQ/YmgE (transglycosylase-associated protein family)
MKIYFPKYRSRAFLTKKRDARWIIAFIIICFLAGLCGSHLFLANHFGLLAIIVLGILGILLAAAAYAFLNWNKIDETIAAPIKKTVPRIRAGWDYRPRQAIRRYAAFDSATAEASHVLSPEPFAINNNVWCTEDSYVNA